MKFTVVVVDIMVSKKLLVHTCLVRVVTFQKAHPSIIVLA